MKKVIITLFLVNLFLFAKAQRYTPYVQLEAGGMTFLFENNISLSTEIGVSYKWLDIGFSFNHELSKSIGNSLHLIAKVDIIGLFTEDSRHSLKLGSGYILSNRTLSYVNNELEAHEGVIGDFPLKYGSPKISYEYQLKPKFSVGAYVGGGTFTPTVGLLLRSNL